MTMLDDMRPGWITEGACRGRDLDDFFVDDISVDAKGVPRLTWPVIRAKDVCADCPFRVECLEWAFAVEGRNPGERRYGIYGAMTGRERELAAKESHPIERLLWVFEGQRRKYNLGSLRRWSRRWSRRGQAAVG